MSDSQHLEPILKGFREEIINAADTREGVSVAVMRNVGFQNIATTPGGEIITLDEPVHFGGRGEAPDPAQYLLAAIGASLSVTLTAHAALRGIDFDDVSMRISAYIDGRAFFIPGCDAPPGLLDIGIDLTVTGRLDREAFDMLLAEVLLSVPVLRTLHTMPDVRVAYAQSD